MGNRAPQPVVILLAGAMLSVPAIAQVQPGSTGGTIGKQDKSISGGEELRTTKHKDLPVGSERGSVCTKVAGSYAWSWLNQKTVVTLNPDGSSSATNGNMGNWTCAGRTITINWAFGGANVMNLSTDGGKLHGTNATAGISISGVRMSGP